MATNPRLPIASLVKSLRVVETLASAGGVLSVSDLIVRTDLERSTVQRVLTTLQAEGYVERTARGEYSVAPRGYVLGATLSTDGVLAVAAMPVLRGLQQASGETVHAGVLDCNDVVSIAHLPADRTLAFIFPVGARVPAYASALGRVLLAWLAPEHAMEVLRQTERPGRTTRTLRSLDQLRSELERVRSGGYATTVDEIEIGVSSIAAPVFGPTGRAIAALNIVFPTSNGKLERRVDKLVPVVVGAARDLSGQLGWREPAGRDQNLDSQRISRADES